MAKRTLKQKGVINRSLQHVINKSKWRRAIAKNAEIENRYMKKDDAR